MVVHVIVMVEHQMLFADSDSEGEYLPFGNDDRHLTNPKLLNSSVNV